MSNEEIGRLGVACVIAVLGALVESQMGLCSEESPFRKAIFWWLVMVGGCGSIIDATNGTKKKHLLIMSILVSLAFIFPAVFMSVVDQSGNFCFSGIGEHHPAAIFLAIFVWIVTAISVFLLSFSQPIIKSIIIKMSNEKTVQQIKNIENSVRAAICLIAVIALLLKIN